MSSQRVTKVQWLLKKLQDHPNPIEQLRRELALAWDAGYAAAGRDVQQLLSGEAGERERNPYDKEG